MEAEWSLSPVIKKWGSQKGFCAQEPHRVWFGIDSSNTGFPFSHFLNHALPKCVCGGGGRKEYLDGESKREKTGIQMGGRRNWILLKLSSPAESVINLSTQNFVPFLVLRIEEHQRKGGGGVDWNRAGSCKAFLSTSLPMSPLPVWPSAEFQTADSSSVGGCVWCGCVTKCSREWLSDCIVPPGRPGPMLPCSLCGSRAWWGVGYHKHVAWFSSRFTMAPIQAK